PHCITSSRRHAAGGRAGRSTRRYHELASVSRPLGRNRASPRHPEGNAMPEKFNRFNLDDLARQLAQSLPQNLRALGGDLERNFRAMLHSGLERMDIVSREEFDLQSAVLERT